MLKISAMMTMETSSSPRLLKPKSAFISDEERATFVNLSGSKVEPLRGETLIV